MVKLSFFPNMQASRRAGVAVAAMMMAAIFSVGFSVGAAAQVTGSSQTTTGANGNPQETVTLSTDLTKKNKKDDKVLQSKDTKRELRKVKKAEPLLGVDSKLPDKQLYDKALEQIKKGHYDVGRLDLQTLLNTYPDSEYQMRSKLAIADSWYREGGTAALTQAEAEYADFRIFFPNQPEAAEAQMRIGDIYFRQMDKPDRDYSKATHAEEEYRRMLTDYPESTLVPDAQQRLRDVQEALATRESEIGAFYSTHANWPATIARYQTVIDSYPQYSHIDDVLVGLGDAYSAEARFVRTLKLPEAGKARLETTYDDLAAAAYRKVVLEHAASPHVEDARDRLAAMNVPIPAPTAEQMAASAALENSRKSYRLQDRLGLLILHKPDVVQAATIGAPLLVDPKPVTAPSVLHQIEKDFNSAMNPNAPAPAAVAAGAGAAAGTPAAAGPEGPVAPLSFQEVPNADAGSGNGGGAVMNVAPATSATRGGATTGMGVEIITPSSAPAPADNGLKPVGPENSAPLPAVEKAPEAPAAINAIAPGQAPAAQAPNPNGKAAKPEFDKKNESDSKQKKKKGLGKLNPF